MKRLIPLAIALAAAPGAALAQDHAQTCAATDQALPAELQPWLTPAPAGAALAPGTAVTLALHPVAHVQTVATPRPARQGETTAARIELEIATAGTYSVALGNAGWIDVVRDGQPLDSAAHGHGPACSTIRKIVNFSLAPGRYTVQISGTDAASVRLLVALR